MHVLLILAVASWASIGSIGQTFGQQPAKAPQVITNYKPFFKAESFYKQEKSGLGLKASWMKIKYKSLDDNPKNPPVASVKLAMKEELVPCPPKLLIERKDQENKLDCQPLKSFYHSQGCAIADLKNKETLYIKRSTLKYNDKLNFIIENETKKDFVFYPLKLEVILESVKNDEEVYNIGEHNANYGYYFETQLLGKRGSPDGYVCSGNIILSINQTEVFVPDESDPDFPEFLDEFYHVFDEAKHNSYRLKFSEVYCYKPLSNLSLFNLEFFISHQQHFPYLILRHNMAFSNYLWVYKAALNQMRNQTVPTAYTTHLDINSVSAIIPFLSFNLEQQFEHSDATHGHENMRFTTPDKFVATVFSMWSPEKFIKLLNVYSSKQILAAASGSDNKLPELTTILINWTNHLNINFNFTESLLKDLSSSPLKLLKDMYATKKQVENSSLPNRDEL